MEGILKSTGLSIDITKMINIEEEGVNLPKGHILQRSPFYIFIGPPKSGKSTIIQTLISHESLYLKKFNLILFVSPSGFNGLELDLDNNWYPSFNLQWIYEKINILKENKTQQQVLLILDDCVSELKAYETKPDFNRLFYNRRHIIPNVCVSIFLTTQYWMKIPSSIRAMSTGIFIFSINSTEWIKMIKETPIGESPKLKTIVASLSSKPHSFIYINFNNNKKYLNFESELLL